MDVGQLKGTPREVYGGIVNLVEGIFKDDSLILTGSAVGILNGSSDDLTTHRMTYLGNPQGGRYYIQPSPKDIDLLIVSPTSLIDREGFFAEKVLALEGELNEDHRILLDIAIADPYILTILDALGEEVEKFEKAHFEENFEELVDIRNYRNAIINGPLNQVGYLFAPLNIQPFVHCPDVPSGNQLHTHTISLAAGKDYMVFGNQELSDRVVESSKSAYIPEELGEVEYSSEVYSKLKESNVGTMPEDIYQIFMMLARHEGFRRAEIKQGRKAVGLWDPAYGEHNVQGFKTIFKSEYPKLLDMIYD